MYYKKKIVLISNWKKMPKTEELLFEAFMAAKETVIKF